mmetsp:Transcript_13989/g.25246  ORF Transcript_13989/g.25246 Transcript_13989/m.25246 type:complete len:101 (-) Transcript_13989:490-792(-)
MQKISEEFNTVFLITNQVVVSQLEGCSLYVGANIKPIGGNIMAHYTNVRVWIKKSNMNIKIFRLISSSKCDDKEIKFIITSTGILAKKKYLVSCQKPNIR